MDTIPMDRSRVRSLPDGEWGPWHPAQALPAVSPMPTSQQVDAIGYLLHTFVKKASQGILGRKERRRRMRIASLELQLMRYEFGTHLYDETRKKMLDSAQPGG